MKQLYKSIGYICIIFFCSQAITAQNYKSYPIPLDSVRSLFKEAKSLQYGYNCDLNYEKAVSLYEELAAMGVSQAYSELGKMYRNGEGVEQNYEKAHELFKEGMSLRNSDAAYNLGLLYHKGEGVKQNFKIAFKLYNYAAAGGSPDGYYGVGYFLYKGLGVEQDYEKAIRYLQKGADMKHAGCTYLLATYYNNGYSDESEMDKGKEYLNKALKAGHGWTYDIVKHNRLDSLKKHTHKSSYHWTDVKRKKLSPEKKRLNNKANENYLQGTWTGKVYTYDWGGKKIMSEEEIELNIGFQGSNLNMVWTDPSTGNSVVNFLAENKGKVWKSIEDNNSSGNWVLDQAKFDIVEEQEKPYLYVDFRKISLNTREPRRPSMAVLERKPLDVSCSIISKVFPTPIENEINIEFSLPYSQEIRFEIYNVTGNIVYSSESKKYQEGSNTETLQISLHKGNYLLNIIGNNFSESITLSRK